MTTGPATGLHAGTAAADPQSVRRGRTADPLLARGTGTDRAGRTDAPRPEGAPAVDAPRRTARLVAVAPAATADGRAARAAAPTAPGGRTGAVPGAVGTDRCRADSGPVAPRGVGSARAGRTAVRVVPPVGSGRRPPVVARVAPRAAGSGRVGRTAVPAAPVAASGRAGRTAVPAALVVGTDRAGRTAVPAAPVAASGRAGRTAVPAVPVVRTDRRPRTGARVAPRAAGSGPVGRTAVVAAPVVGTARVGRTAVLRRPEVHRVGRDVRLPVLRGVTAPSGRTDVPAARPPASGAAAVPTQVRAHRGRGADRRGRTGVPSAPRASSSRVHASVPGSAVSGPPATEQVPVPGRTSRPAVRVATGVPARPGRTAQRPAVADRTADVPADRTVQTTNARSARRSPSGPTRGSWTARSVAR